LPFLDLDGLARLRHERRELLSASVELGFELRVAIAERLAVLLERLDVALETGDGRVARRHVEVALRVARAERGARRVELDLDQLVRRREMQERKTRSHIGASLEDGPGEAEQDRAVELPVVVDQRLADDVA
jgi:hypothetical protein